MARKPGPCLVRGCERKRASHTYSKYCNLHRKRATQYAHPEQHPLSLKLLRQTERRIRAALRMLSPELRERIETNTARTVALLREYVAGVKEEEAAGREARRKLPKTVIPVGRHKAAEHLLPVLANREPMDVLVRVAAVILIYQESPSLFHNSDDAYKALLFDSVRKLYRVQTRFWYDHRRPNSPTGGVRGYYHTPPIRARQIGSAWLRESLVSPAMILLRATRATEGARQVEGELARDLVTQVDGEVADYVRRLRLSAYHQLKYRKQKALKAQQAAAAE